MKTTWFVLLVKHFDIRIKIDSRRKSVAFKPTTKNCRNFILRTNRSTQLTIKMKQIYFVQVCKKSIISER